MSSSPTTIWSQDTVRAVGNTWLDDLTDSLDPSAVAEALSSPTKSQSSASKAQARHARHASDLSFTSTSSTVSVVDMQARPRYKGPFGHARRRVSLRSVEDLERPVSDASSSPPPSFAHSPSSSVASLSSLSSYASALSSTDDNGRHMQDESLVEKASTKNALPYRTHDDDDERWAHTEESTITVGELLLRRWRRAYGEPEASSLHSQRSG